VAKAKKQQPVEEKAAPDMGCQPEAPAALEVVEWLRGALQEGQEWPRALLEAVGRWPLTQEEIDGVRCQYLLLGEAFDWMTLAGRLLTAVDGFVSPEDKEALLFQSWLPKDVSEADFRNLLGPEKYRAHLNYFYGVVVEEALLLAVEEELHKERLSRGLRGESVDVVAVAYQRLYGDAQDVLLKAFRQEMKYPETSSISLTELKEFTYWLFKRRIKSSDSARLASDTRKGLERLFRMRSA